MKLNRQQGGTILGIIIGLVIGLGIALTVAVMITKTPVPFTDKFAKLNSKGNEMAGQITDPNKPLYGNKAAVKEAAKDLKEMDAPVNAAAPQSEAKLVKKSDGQALTIENVIAQKTEAKPAIKEAKETKVEVKPVVATTTAAAPIAEASDEKWNYYLQAGAFRDQNDAEGMRGKLALMGVEAKVSERQAENGLLYRVRVGPFNQVDVMNKVRGKLSDNGVDAAVVRIAKQ
jgi:cell division protein FtsN